MNARGIWRDADLTAGIYRSRALTILSPPLADARLWRLWVRLTPEPSR